MQRSGDRPWTRHLLMRFRLVHQLTLLVLATVVLAVSAMGAFVALNLRQGFKDYLRAIDDARLDAFAASAGEVITVHGVQALRLRPELLRAPLASVAAGDPEPAEPPAAQPPTRDARPPAGPVPPPSARGLALIDTVGQQIWGGPMPRGRSWIERSVTVQNRIVAWARLSTRSDVPEGLDARFLGRQYAGIGAVGVALALASAAAAVWLARRWTRPLSLTQAAARRLTQGHFDALLPAPTSRCRDEIDDLIDDVNALAESLRALEGSRRRWIAELSHELRTPLTVLRGELDAIGDGLIAMDANAVASLQGEVTRLMRLADEFHLLALSDLRALPTEAQTLAPAMLLREAVQRHRHAADAVGLALVLVDQGLPAHVEWDGDRIAQVLDNLLANAIAYTDAPGRIVVTAAQLDDGVQLCVDDSAPGVSAADLSRVFEPLFRADSSRARDRGGSGLGLAISRAVVVGHGGSMVAAPSPLGGLQLRIRLPLRAATAPIAADSA
jgi:two-component system, OmpR family, sensor histidine kinase BaeS